MNLNRDQIKYIAIITMTFNHVAHGLLAPGTLVYEIFENIGYFTAVTMCFFLVEGYHHTNSIRRYALRLLLFGVISEIPYVFSQGFYEIGFFQPCIMFSLLICLGVIHVANSKLGTWKKRIIIFVLVLLSVPCDWSFVLPVATLLFEKSRGDIRKNAIAYASITVIFFLINFMSFLSGGTRMAVIRAGAASVGLIISGIFVLCLYSGQKGKRFTRFNRWFFYIYYPLHLTVIAILRYSMISFPAR